MGDDRVLDGELLVYWWWTKHTEFGTETPHNCDMAVGD